MAQGIDQGYTSGDLTFTKNQWNGIANDGEIELTGSWLSPNESEYTVYIYAGANCIAEYSAGTAASSPEQEYVYADQIDSLVMIARGSQKLTVTRNQQWSVTSLVDSSDGAVLERYAYDIFGKRTILGADGSTVRLISSYNNPYGYTSRRHDEETGLCYFRARYYDPTSGEFVSRDPLEYVDGMSLYRGYMGVKAVDPFGGNTIVEFFSSAECCKDEDGNDGNLKIVEAVVAACARIRKTLDGLKKYREVLRELFKNPSLALGGLATLSDEDYQKVIDNFEKSAECCSTGIKIDCRALKGKRRCNGDTELYTKMNIFTYKAMSNIYICPLFYGGSEERRTVAMAHEIGRFCGKQFENSTNDPIWDVTRWGSLH